MEEKKEQVAEKEIMPEKEYKEFEKEGYLHLVNIKNDKKMVLYIEKGMPLNVAFDGALDFSFYLRNLYKEQLDNALKKANEESAEKEEAKADA